MYLQVNAIYRGELPEIGRGYLFVFSRTVDLLVINNFITEDEAITSLKEIQNNINDTG